MRKLHYTGTSFPFTILVFNRGSSISPVGKKKNKQNGEGVRYTINISTFEILS